MFHHAHFTNVREQWLDASTGLLTAIPQRALMQS